MSKQLNSVSHDYIRYANCWEDADILLEGLSLQPGDRILSIGSAGDNSFSLLVNNPEIVVAVDINFVQLNLIELKKAAFKTLNYTDFISFLGFKPCDNRWELFQNVKKELSPELILFWTAKKEEIKGGVIYQGKFERYFQLFHKKILPFIHSKRKIKCLFEEKSEIEQQQFFEKKWNNWRWRMLFKIFFSKSVMGKFGRDPQFLKEVEVPVSTFIIEQAKRHLSSKACQKNYFLYFILTGQFSNYLPHYAREENFLKIKENVGQLSTFYGLAEDVFKQHKGFNKFNLSNIFEYMNPDLFEKVSRDFSENGAVNARYAYWNLMVPRLMSNTNSSLRLDQKRAKQLSNKDKGFFYGNFIVETKE